MQIIRDEQETRELLMRAAASYAEITIQFRNGEKYSSRLLDEGVRDGILHVELKGDLASQKFKTEAQEARGTEFLAMVSLQGKYLLGMKFQGDTVRFEGGALHLKIPERLAKIQRRAEARYVIPSGYELFIHFKGIARKVIDVSQSGLSFLVSSPGELDAFNAGDVVKDVHFRVQGRAVWLDLQIKNKARTGKVGTKFHKIKLADQKVIESFVFSNLLQRIG